MTDFRELKASFDLLRLVEQDLGPGSKCGRWQMYHCPFPGHAHGDRHPSLAVTADNGRWHCFTCGRSGDALGWLRDFRTLSWQEIARLAGGPLQAGADLRCLTPDDSSAADIRAPEASVDPSASPSDEWQAHGMTVMHSAEYALWQPEGERALSWLRERGLKDGTIRHYHLGYHPHELYEPPERWGLDAASMFRRSGSLWLPRGIVIPCIVAGVLWYLKIRRPRGRPKYIQLRGGKPALFGADDLRGAEIVLLTEGELDCVLAGQELGDVLGAATLGSAAKHLDLHTWGRYLLPARLVLTAYDLDAAGQAGSQALQQLSARMHRLQAPALRPGDKDLSDYFAAGGDLWEWLKHQLKGLGPLEWGLPEGMVVANP